MTPQSLSRMLQRSLALLVPLLAIALADKSYHGYKVLRTGQLDQAATELLQRLMVTDNVDFWREPALGQ